MMPVSKLALAGPRQCLRAKSRNLLIQVQEIFRAPTFSIIKLNPIFAKRNPKERIVILIREFLDSSAEM